MTHPTIQAVLDAEEAVREGLLTVAEMQAVHRALQAHCDVVLGGTDIISLRYRRLKSGTTWWSIGPGGFPTKDEWDKFKPFLDLLAQRGTDRTIKRKLKTEDVFVTTTYRGDDLHILVGRRDGSGEKAHVIVDDRTAEIRIEDDQGEPTDIFPRITTILETRDGRRIKSTREALESLSDDASDNEPRD